MGFLPDRSMLILPWGSIPSWVHYSTTLGFIVTNEFTYGSEMGFHSGQ